jgi:transcriptional regulator with XRE-family HTH domain
MAKSSARDPRLYQRIGFAIAKLRARKGLTALVLAGRAGVHRNLICRVESGRGISVLALYRIAEALGQSIDSLISFSPQVVHLDLQDKKAAKVNCESDKLF